jgi:hypothetical protein
MTINVRRNMINGMKRYSWGTAKDRSKLKIIAIGVK